MNVLLALPWMPRIAWALLHSLWEGTLVGLAAALLLHLLRGHSPRLRYAVAVAALLAMVVLPARRLAGPDVGMRNAISAPALTGALKSPSSAAVSLTARAASPERLLDRALPWIVLAWGSGALVCLLRLAGGWVWLQRLRWQKAELAPDVLQGRLLALCRRAGLRRAVSLLTCEGLDGPSVVGFLRPAILVPAGWFLNLPTDHVEALLAHELAHVLRHDYAVNLLQSLVEVLMFYHPGVWWLSRRIRAERELSCDAFAARLLGDALPLAEALLSLETRAQRPFQPELAPAAHGGSLMERIRQLLSPQPRTSAAPAVGFLAFGCLLVSASAHLSARNPQAANVATTRTVTVASATFPVHFAMSAAPVLDEQGRPVPYRWTLDIQAKDVPLYQAWRLFERLGAHAPAKVEGGLLAQAASDELDSSPRITLDLVKVDPAAVLRAFEEVAKSKGVPAFAPEPLGPFTLEKHTDPDGTVRLDMHAPEISRDFLQVWLETARKVAAEKTQPTLMSMAERHNDQGKGVKVDALFRNLTLPELEKRVAGLMRGQ